MVKQPKIRIQDVAAGQTVRAGRGYGWATVESVQPRRYDRNGTDGIGRIHGYTIRYTDGSAVNVPCAGKVEIQR